MALNTNLPAPWVDANNVIYGVGTSNQVPLPQFLSQFCGKNSVINGACAVQQYASVALANNVSSYGGVDRFAAWNGGAGGQFTQSAGTITYNGVARPAVFQTVNTAAAGFASGAFWWGIVQKIEGLNCYHLIGQPVAKSFIFYTNVSGQFTASITDATGNNSYVMTFSAVAGTPVKLTFSVPALPASFGASPNTSVGLYLRIGSLNAGSFQTSTPNQWVSGSYFSAPGNVNWGAAVGNFIAATEIQLEPGANPTSFEREPYPLTLLKCMRYYELLLPSASGTAMDYGPMVVLSATQAIGRVWWSVYKRARPSFVFSSAATYSFYSTSTGNIALSSLSMSAANFISAFASATFSGGGTAGQIGFLEDSAGASYIGILSEL